MVDVEKAVTDMKKLETAFMKTNSITDAWWTNEGITKMFDGAVVGVRVSVTWCCCRVVKSTSVKWLDGVKYDTLEKRCS